MKKATAFTLALLLATAGAAAREGTAIGGSAHRVHGETTEELEASRLTLADPTEDVRLPDDGELFGVRGRIDELRAAARARANYDTLWFFDADFEDMSQPNNQGWVSYDRSGTLGQENYWHKDTIRINGFTHLGDSTWWCGTYNGCWVQPRGYGNNWSQHLWRDFPLSEWSTASDEVTFTFDQRFAMEHDYDFGFIDISTNGGADWTTLYTVNNPGFPGKPGTSQDWDSVAHGHRALDLSDYAGTDVRLRLRFESDGAYSSQDMPDNGPPNHSVLDGAWQLDNLTWHIWDAVVWVDDCESPGDNGWVHEDVPTTGQTGVTWRRTFEDPPYERGGRPGWMMSAYDSLAGTTVDHESTILNSPPIDIAGATALVAEWTGWQDLPPCSSAAISLWLTVGDSPEEVYCSLPDIGGPAWGWYSGGPFYFQVTDDWTAYAGSDWLGLWWWQSAGTADEPGCHGTGFMLDRHRLGTPVPTSATIWSYSPWDRFDDTFDLEAALEDTARVTISDDDGIAAADLLVSDDGGTTWSAHALVPVAPGGDDWLALPPAGHLVSGTEIHYYFVATDLTGDASAFPANAPDAYYEYSVLPIKGSTEEPAILLVDKHGGLVPGADWEYSFTSEYYYREALDILGHVYDVYDVPVPGSATDLGNGPDTSGMKYYDTQIWFASNTQGPVITFQDQTHLLSWLNEGMGGIDRNFLISGNNTSEWISSIFLEFLATEFVSGSVSNVQVELRGAPGGFDFMTHGDGECEIHRGDPYSRNTFDVLQSTGVAGAEIVADYVDGAGLEPAGVAYSTPLMTYQTVNLGFGIEFMMGGAEASLPSGDYATGLHDRVDLMGNIMEYFGKAPGGPGTGVDEQFTSDDRLARAYPNPFRPSTTIEYVVSSPDRVTLRVYDPAGRVVTTLVDAVVEPGRHEAVWDGRTSTGDRAASGVYFVRMETGGFSSAKKVVLLR